MEKIQGLDSINSSFRLTLNQMNGRVLIDAGEHVEIHGKVLIRLGKNVARDAERFFHVPYLWIFKAQKARMLMKTLARISEAGSVGYLDEQTNNVMFRMYVKEAGGKLGQTNEAYVALGVEVVGNERAGFSDIGLAECFALAVA